MVHHHWTNVRSSQNTLSNIDKCLSDIEEEPYLWIGSIGDRCEDVLSRRQNHIDRFQSIRWVVSVRRETVGKYRTYFSTDPTLRQLLHWHNKTSWLISVTNKYQRRVSEERMSFMQAMISIDTSQLTFRDVNVKHGWKRSADQSETVQSADDDKKTPLAIGLQAIRYTGPYWFEKTFLASLSFIVLVEVLTLWPEYVSRYCSLYDTEHRWINPSSVPHK